jgi:glucose-6-phosphate dehydrogenase assembly protein OpcA
MTAQTATSGAAFEPIGWPVEIGRIDKELGRLWEESGDSKTRASLINLVIYTEDPGRVPELTSLIAGIAGEHACRAILVLAEPQAPRDEASAWIAAHCHLEGKGERQICSEQITFHLQGLATQALPSIVFSHLDSDLPLVFWWLPPLPSDLDTKFWRWVDRLIFDSSTWTEPGPSLDQLRKIAACRDTSADRARRTILCDLTWTRLLGARFAFASLFDHQSALAQLDRVEKVILRHGPGGEMAALLFLGWIADRLRWELHSMMADQIFVQPNGREVRFFFESQEDSGCQLAACELQSPGGTFQLIRDPAACHYELSMRGPEVPEFRSTVNAEQDDLQATLLSELSRGGAHPLYFRALEKIRPLADQL